MEVLGVEVWDKMSELAHTVFANTETWVRAGHGVSKTMSAACLAEYWFSCLGWPVVSTAPSGHQVKDLLWRQIRTNHMRAKRRLPGRRLEIEIKVDGRPDWFAYGFSTDNPERAQGPHFDNLLIIADEAAGIPTWLWTAIKGWMTNPGVRLLAIGNPNTKREDFYAAFHERLADVGTVHISCTDSPNYKAGRIVVPGLATREWVEDRAKEWGEDSAEFRMKVLGDFPADGDEKILPMDWIDAAFQFGAELAAEEAELPSEQRAALSRISKVALDVARQGKDMCALVYLAGQRIRIAKYWKQPNTNRTARDAMQWVSTLQQKPEWLIVDANAVGGGTYDTLEVIRDENREVFKTAFGACKLAALDWSSSPDEPARYCWKVDELYGRLRNRLDPKKPRQERLALPTDAELAAVGLTRKMLTAQLNARKFQYDERNRIKVETKKELRKRKKELGFGDSPDIADAIAALMHQPKQQRVALAIA